MDIGCGVLVYCLGRVKIDLEKLDKVIRKFVPSGFSVHDTALSHDPNLKDLHCRHTINMERADQSLGTLGGGNHFIEVDQDNWGGVYLVIHSGSRNVGVQVCKWYQQLAENNCLNSKPDYMRMIAQLKAEGRTNEIQDVLQSIKSKNISIPKDLCYITGETFDDYLHDMKICQEYAMLNRKCMADIICSHLGLEIVDSFCTVHNYIDTHTKILRKGAISAMPGERLIIPINMRDGPLLCTGKGNQDWLCSAPHGAGRLMSRNKAKESISMEEFNSTMAGIYTTSINESTLDEAPQAYKPMEEIVECIQDTVIIDKVIKPIYNFKASD